MPYLAGSKVFFLIDAPLLFSELPFSISVSCPICRQHLLHRHSLMGRACDCLGTNEVGNDLSERSVLQTESPIQAGQGSLQHYGAQEPIISI
jgi:hypothetical protein